MTHFVEVLEQPYWKGAVGGSARQSVTDRTLLMPAEASAKRPQPGRIGSETPVSSVAVRDNAAGPPHSADAPGDSVASAEPSAPLRERSLEASKRSDSDTPAAGPAPRVTLPLDELSLKFAIWARISAGYCVDIGCGAGIATAAALSRGGRVVAVDVEKRTLETLRGIVPAEQYGRLKCVVGELPDLELPNGEFSAVLVARDLHRLSPDGLQTSLRKMFNWLHPNGKVFVGAPLTAGASHLREEDDFRRELSAAGFIVEEISSQPTAGNRAHMCCAAVARRP